MTEWSSLKVVDLRAELSSRSLPTKGLKAELVQRLIEDDAAAAGAQPDQDPAVEDETPEESVLPAVDEDGISNEVPEPQSDPKANDTPLADAIATVDTLTRSSTLR